MTIWTTNLLRWKTGRDNQLNPFKPKKETKNAYNWNKNEWEATPVVRDMPPKGNTDSKEYSSMVDALEKANVEYRLFN